MTWRGSFGCSRRAPKGNVGGRISPTGAKIEKNEKTADPKAGGVQVPSSDDVSARTRFAGVGGNRFAGDEVQIAFDGKSEFAAY
jgi:hypothetical protein